MPRPELACPTGTSAPQIDVEWEEVFKIWEQVVINEKAACRSRDEWLVLVQAWMTSKVKSTGSQPCEECQKVAPPEGPFLQSENDDHSVIVEKPSHKSHSKLSASSLVSRSYSEEERRRRSLRQHTRGSVMTSLKRKVSKERVHSNFSGSGSSISVDLDIEPDHQTKRMLISRPMFLRKLARLLRRVEDMGWYVTIHSLLIVLSVCTNIFQTMDACVGDISTVMIGFDYCINILFTLEVVLRIATTRRKALCTLFISMYFWVDVFAVVPFYVKLMSRASGDRGNVYVELLTISTPTLRLLKITRQSKVWRLLVRAMRDCVEPISVPTFFLALIVIFSSCILYWVEANFSDGDPAFVSIPHAMWFALVTITTVGYGDVTPHSVPGKVLCAMLMVVGIFYFGMPLAIVGSSFTNVWDGRDSILLMEKFQARLAMDGTTEDELKKIFESMDMDGNGQLVLDEFIIFFTDLDLGFTKQDCITLFRTVDCNQSGAVSFEEFALTLFPKVEVREYNAYNYLTDRSFPSELGSGRASRTSRNSGTSRNSRTSKTSKDSS